MNKIAPVWFWVLWSFFAAIAMIAFCIVGISEDAFNKPVSELPLPYWVVLLSIAVLLAILAVVLFAFSKRSQGEVPQSAKWIVITSNAIQLTIFLGIFLLYAFFQPKQGGILVFVGVMCIFILLTIGITARRLLKARRSRSS